MIPYQIDPSLHPAEPAPPQLDDGFSPPAPEPAAGVVRGAEHEPADHQIGEKSPF